ncbi:rhodanese-like domain-containing protein [Pseudomonas indica]|uniref:Rhodanese-related sulfurtransferase n=1 Tax=Pseudomonas indica TaxID=137658 RepID=A0A1G9D5H5_9PSED|nr:rhodanese-like domain-containing protein [Pseudomonas indica]MBU3056700.1 rhodanese-like domain-containing protein [Pseudomonas indica]PAU54400.1 sulfurtransferase [Pseudomonas indica]SDK59117.1 Rhodanese-related sulfurtransferase [Pseudomonas indica]
MLRTLLVLLVALPLYGQAQEAPLEVKGAVTVNVEQAKRLYDLGAVFIDVRPSREWSWGHVHGAVHLDLAERFSGLAMPHWPRGIPLVIYCDSEVCPRGALAAALAVEWGYEQVFYFREGYFAWQLYDLPQGKGLAGEVVAFRP